MSAMFWPVVTYWRWWLPIAFVVASGCAKPDNTELLKARADKQAAEWNAMQGQEQIEALQARYSELLAEFSAYQDTCKVVPK